ncbi:unnamed protein product [Mycena citricolor]|uniref:NAD(P)-binding domain-containing protein n=1 Tax=Mycena citricolor TaxID=2018698 RepID=A0AAD2HCT5_9AGAR|nr:unnamed protein product [Mycena citricolor]
MKLIITGATGYVGKETVSQACKHSGISTVVAVTRKPIAAPEGTPAGKFKNVVVSDYDQYTDEAKKEFAGANGCIWTVGITPPKYLEVGAAEAKRISHTSTIVGLQAIADSAPSRPFRFCYMSGGMSVRDQTATVEGEFGEFSLMRGDVENAILVFAAGHAGFEACSVKPAWIVERAKVAESLESAQEKGWEMIVLEDCASAMLHVAMNGFEKEPLSNDDLIDIAKRIQAV